MEFNIGNKKINFNKDNIKKIMAIATVGFAVVTAVGCHSDKITEEVAVSTENNYQSLENRYNIEYKVKWDETLSEIVANYESDYNLIERYVKDIKRENNIDGVLKAGTTIKLYGVPESKLGDYGYTSDYSIIGYDIMVKDAYNWLLDGEKWITGPFFDQESVEKYNNDLVDFGVQYNAYLDEEDENKKQQRLDELVGSIEDILLEFKQITGIDFNDYHKAYPLPDEPSYRNEL